MFICLSSIFGVMEKGPRIWDPVIKNIQLIVGALLVLTATVLVDVLGLIALVFIWLVVGLSVAIVYGIRYRWEVGRPESKEETVERLADEVVRTQDIAEGLMVDRSRLRREVSRLEAAKKERPKKRTSGEICDTGPYETEGGEILYIELDVREGERIQGRIEEVDGDDFDWYIVDEANLVLAMNREGFEHERGDHHVPGAVLQWEVLKDGPWFLVLDLYRRFNPRKIEVHFRRHK